MNIIGKVKHRLPVQSGESQRGAWQKVDVVIETPGEHPKNICFTCWSDLVEVAKTLNKGDQVTVAVNIESREYNGNWYTDVRAWKIEKGQPVQQTSTQQPTGGHENLPMSDTEGDLPF